MKEKATLRVAVVTGATSGIGYELVRQLAQAGWRVIGIARSPLRGRLMTETLRAQTGNPHISFQAADLSLVAEATAVAALLVRQYPKIELLINNAGSLFQTRQETPEGVERTFALNHLGLAALTQGLVPAMAGGHIVNVSSSAHYGVTLDINNLEAKTGWYSGWKQYQRSKLMTILYTRALALRLPVGMRVNAVHPGFVATRFGSDNPRWWRIIMRLMMLLAIKPARSAHGVLQVAFDPMATGLYFNQGRMDAPSAVAQDDALAEDLWQKTGNYLERLKNGIQA